MHSFLKSIGFSTLNSHVALDHLLKRVVQESTNRYTAKNAYGITVLEASLYFESRSGITVRGEFDDSGAFYLDHYFPFFESENESTCEDFYVNKRVDSDAYTGLCDDSRVGVSLIFYLQNTTDYLRAVQQQPRGPFRCPINLSALALEGCIIFPTEKNEQQWRQYDEKRRQRSQLIAEAKLGNQKAIESLTIGDIDQYALVSQRIRNREDVYSIVESSFIPYGSESDLYTVLGTILDLETAVNKQTGEALCYLTVFANDILFDICINQNDLLGMPAPGLRFKGTIWLQGKADFQAGTHR